MPKLLPETETRDPKKPASDAEETFFKVTLRPSGRPAPAQSHVKCIGRSMLGTTSRRGVETVIPRVLHTETYEVQASDERRAKTEAWVVRRGWER